MAISRMQQPRQQYGLGSLVKKAVRGVKKIVKSPLGKAALLGGLGMYGFGAGPFQGMKGAGFLRNMMGARNAAGAGKFLASGAAGGARLPSAIAARNPGFFSKMLGGAGKLLNPWQSGQFSGKHAFGLASAAALAAPFLMGKDDEEEEIEEAWTSVPSSIADIRNQARNYYRVGSAGSDLNFMPGKQFVQPNYYAADGGRVGLLNGGDAGQEQIEQMLMAEFVKYKNQGGTLTFEQFVQAIMQQQQEGQGMEQPQEVAMAANGGRIGYKWGGLGNLASRTGGAIKNLKNALVTKLGRMTDDVEISTLSDYADDTGAAMELSFVAKSKKGKSTLDGLVKEGILDVSEGIYYPKAMMADDAVIGMEKLKASGVIEEGGEFRRFDQGAGEGEYGMPYYGYDQLIETFGKTKKADGGRIGAYAGGLMSEDEDEYAYNPQAAMRMYKRPGKQEGGIMETEVAEEMIDLGGKEKDYRETGGFVEIGGKERADDVPARLSKNEFVFTADAVRNAGGGDIDKGSEVMQNLMDNLEAGGEVSEESQGLEGAQAMYDQQQMLQSRMI